MAASGSSSRADSGATKQTKLENGAWDERAARNLTVAVALPSIRSLLELKRFSRLSRRVAEDDDAAQLSPAFLSDGL